MAETTKCLDETQVHNIREYHDKCEKCELDLASVQIEMGEMRPKIGANDTSLTVIVGLGMFILGGVVGAVGAKH